MRLWGDDQRAPGFPISLKNQTIPDKIAQLKSATGTPEILSCANSHELCESSWSPGGGARRISAFAAPGYRNMNSQVAQLVPRV
jgi:hypothetical protein